MDMGRCLLLATVTGVKDSSVVYPCCSECYSKLLQDASDNSHWCSRCHTSYDGSRAMYRYRLSLTAHAAERSCLVHLTAFGRMLQPFFGISASAFNRFIQSLPHGVPGCTDLLMKSLELRFLGRQFWFGLRNNEGFESTHCYHSSQFSQQRGADMKKGIGMVASQMIPVQNEQITVFDNLKCLLEDGPKYMDDKISPRKKLSECVMRDCTNLRLSNCSGLGENLSLATPYCTNNMGSNQSSNSCVLSCEKEASAYVTYQGSLIFTKSIMINDPKADLSAPGSLRQTENNPMADFKAYLDFSNTSSASSNGEDKENSSQDKSITEATEKLTSAKKSIEMSDCDQTLPPYPEISVSAWSKDSNNFSTKSIEILREKSTNVSNPDLSLMDDSSFLLECDRMENTTCNVPIISPKRESGATDGQRFGPSIPNEFSDLNEDQIYQMLESIPDVSALPQNEMFQKIPKESQLCVTEERRRLTMPGSCHINIDVGNEKERSGVSEEKQVCGADIDECNELWEDWSDCHQSLSPKEQNVQTGLCPNQQPVTNHMCLQNKVSAQKGDKESPTTADEDSTSVLPVKTLSGTACKALKQSICVENQHPKQKSSTSSDTTHKADIWEFLPESEDLDAFLLNSYSAGFPSSKTSRCAENKTELDRSHQNAAQNQFLCDQNSAISEIGPSTNAHCGNVSGVTKDLDQSRHLSDNISVDSSPIVSQNHVVLRGNVSDKNSVPQKVQDACSVEYLPESEDLEAFLMNSNMSETDEDPKSLLPHDHGPIEDCNCVDTAALNKEKTKITPDQFSAIDKTITGNINRSGSADKCVSSEQGFLEAYRDQKTATPSLHGIVCIDQLEEVTQESAENQEAEKRGCLPHSQDWEAIFTDSFSPSILSAKCKESGYNSEGPEACFVAESEDLETETAQPIVVDAKCSAVDGQHFLEPFPLLSPFKSSKFTSPSIKHNLVSNLSVKCNADHVSNCSEQYSMDLFEGSLSSSGEPESFTTTVGTSLPDPILESQNVDDVEHQRADEVPSCNRKGVTFSKRLSLVSNIQMMDIRMRFATKPLDRKCKTPKSCLKMHSLLPLPEEQFSGGRNGNESNSGRFELPVARRISILPGSEELFTPSPVTGDCTSRSGMVRTWCSSSPGVDSSTPLLFSQCLSSAKKRSSARLKTPVDIVVSRLSDRNSSTDLFASPDLFSSSSVNISNQSDWIPPSTYRPTKLGSFPIKTMFKGRKSSGSDSAVILDLKSNESDCFTNVADVSKKVHCDERVDGSLHLPLNSSSSSPEMFSPDIVCGSPQQVDLGAGGFVRKNLFF